MLLSKVKDNQIIHDMYLQQCIIVLRVRDAFTYLSMIGICVTSLVPKISIQAYRRRDKRIRTEHTCSPNTNYYYRVYVRSLTLINGIRNALLIPSNRLIYQLPREGISHCNDGIESVITQIPKMEITMWNAINNCLFWSTNTLD